MRSLHHYYPKNEHGTDYGVGDIHGAFPYLEAKLEQIGFNPEIDRLFGTGDIVDKGRFSKHAYTWLQKSWFKTVAGNHDLHVANFGKPTLSKWIENQGKWFSHLKPVFQKQMQEAFAKLPICITVETPDGFVGLVHAGTRYDTWYETLSFLDSSATKAAMEHLVYSRDGYENRHEGRCVRDLKALVVGHCPVPTAEKAGNVWYIDTNAYHSGEFTLLNLHTLELL